MMNDYKTSEDLKAWYDGSRKVTKEGWIASLVAFGLAIISWIFIALIGLMMLPNDARADDSKFWITPGAISYHMNREKAYNELNFGFGLEYRASKDFSLSAGQYRNSINRTSLYALAAYTPIHFSESVRAGVLVGVVNGYETHHGQFIPAVLPVLAVELKHVGFNITFAPPFRDKVDGAFAVQLKFRF